MRYVARLDRPEIIEATRHTYALWGTGRSQEIPEHEFHYVLATTIVGPVEWIREHGWRQLHPHELVAIARITTRFGELMGLRGLPTTYDGYLRLLRGYEAEHFAHTPAATRLAEATIRIGRTTAPLPLKPLTRRVAIAMMDEPLREALGLPRQPACRLRRSKSIAIISSATRWRSDSFISVPAGSVGLFLIWI